MIALVLMLNAVCAQSNVRKQHNVEHIVASSARFESSEQLADPKAIPSLESVEIGANGNVEISSHFQDSTRERASIEKRENDAQPDGIADSTAELSSSLVRKAAEGAEDATVQLPASLVRKATEGQVFADGSIKLSGGLVDATGKLSSLVRKAAEGQGVADDGIEIVGQSGSQNPINGTPPAISDPGDPPTLPVYQAGCSTPSVCGKTTCVECSNCLTEARNSPECVTLQKSSDCANTSEAQSQCRERFSQCAKDERHLSCASYLYCNTNVICAGDSLLGHACGCCKGGLLECQYVPSQVPFDPSVGEKDIHSSVIEKDSRDMDKRVSLDDSVARKCGSGIELFKGGGDQSADR